MSDPERVNVLPNQFPQVNQEVLDKILAHYWHTSEKDKELIDLFKSAEPNCAEFLEGLGSRIKIGTVEPDIKRGALNVKTYLKYAAIVHLALISSVAEGEDLPTITFEAIDAYRESQPSSVEVYRAPGTQVPDRSQSDFVDPNPKNYMSENRALMIWLDSMPGAVGVYGAMLYYQLKRQQWEVEKLNKELR